MIKTQPIKKYIAPAIVATSIAVFSPVLIDEASAHGGPDIEETSNTEVNTSSSSDSSEAENGGISIIGDYTIMNIQEALRDKGYNLAADGINGPKTEKTLKSFQSDEGIQVDGIVGDATAKALGLSSSSSNNGSGDNDDTQGPPPGGDSDGDDSDNGDSDSDNEDSGNGSSEASNSEAIADGKALNGKPYVAGGESPAGFVCSGFINYVFEQQGVELERTHAGMWASNGEQVSNPKPCDVVFFENTYQPGISHSGIYLGNDKMIHAGTEDTGVEITDMTIDYWDSRYIGAKRF